MRSVLLCGRRLTWTIGKRDRDRIDNIKMIEGIETIERIKWVERFSNKEILISIKENRTH